MKVIGIDENGLGSIMGPFVITASLFEMDEDVFFYANMKHIDVKLQIDDSKNVFKRKFPYTYSKGEIIALSLLGSKSFSQLLSEHYELLIESWEKEIYIKDYELPIWAKDVKYSIGDTLGFLDLKGIAIFPSQFNKLLDKLHKFQMDVKFFLELAHKLAQGEEVVVLAGKVGGYTYYLKVFRLLGITDVKVLKESRGHSAYVLDYKGTRIRIHFLLDGDAHYYPIALSSIVGKYVREIFMKALNEHFGFEGKIPYASGYRHDYKTIQLINSLEDSEKFLRRR